MPLCVVDEAQAKLMVLSYLAHRTENQMNQASMLMIALGGVLVALSAAGFVGYVVARHLDKKVAQCHQAPGKHSYAGDL